MNQASIKNIQGHDHQSFEWCLTVNEGNHVRILGQSGTEDGFQSELDSLVSAISEYNYLTEMCPELLGVFFRTVRKINTY